MSFSIINNDQKKFYAICMDLRFGATAFTTALEYRYFPPSVKELNDRFSINTVQWNGNAWYLVSIPLKYRQEALRTASELGLKLVGGVPTMICGKEKNYFPIQDGENVFTLENRERPMIHMTPCLTETQLKVEIIREAGTFWKADFSKNIKLVESMASFDDKQSTISDQNIMYKLASKSK